MSQNSHPRIYAITGNKTNGKDYFGEILINKINEESPHIEIIHLSFAEPLKAALSAITGIDVNLFSNQSYKETSFYNIKTGESVFLTSRPDGDNWFSLRELMQYFGTDIMHGAFTPAIWIQAAINKMKFIAKDNTVFVITDLRFKIEADLLRQFSKNATVIKIVNPNIIPDLSHKSEQDVSIIQEDFHINNEWSESKDNNDYLKDCASKILKHGNNSR